MRALLASAIITSSYAFTGISRLHQAPWAPPLPSPTRALHTPRLWRNQNRQAPVTWSSDAIEPERVGDIDLSTAEEKRKLLNSVAALNAVRILGFRQASDFVSEDWHR